MKNRKVSHILTHKELLCWYIILTPLLLIAILVGAYVLVDHYPIADEDVKKKLLARDYIPEYEFFFDDAEEALKFYSTFAGELETVRAVRKVRPYFAFNLPGDLSTLSAAQKKQLFIMLLLPSIIRANDKIAQERDDLLEIISKVKGYKGLMWRDHALLLKLSKKYSVSNGDFEQLLVRIDTVPVSLALAQAIIESGWGTSRFSRQGNGLYGLHLPEGNDGKYIMSRHGGVKVAAYETIYGASAAYLQNLNSTRAYKELREIRKDLKGQGGGVSGTELAKGLTSYSEIGGKYVAYIEKVIRVNSLEDFNEVTIEDLSAVSIRFR